MSLYVFVFLLIDCLLLSLARLGCLGRSRLRPSSPWGGARGSTRLRLLNPRTPDDCPAYSPYPIAAAPALQNLCTEGQTRRRKINRVRRRKGILQVRTVAHDEWVQPVAWIEWVNAPHHTFRYMAQDIR